MSFYCFWLRQRLRNWKKIQHSREYQWRFPPEVIAFYLCSQVFNSNKIMLFSCVLPTFAWAPEELQGKEQCKIMWKVFNKNLYRVIENFSLFVKPYGGVITEFPLMNTVLHCFIDFLMVRWETEKVSGKLWRKFYDIFLENLENFIF